MIASNMRYLVQMTRLAVPLIETAMIFKTHTAFALDLKGFLMTLLRTFAATGTLTLALMSGTSAYALDANAFAEKLAAALSQSGNTMTIGNAVGTGDTITLTELAFSPQGVDSPFEFEGGIVFTGVKETGDGGYTAEVASIDAIEIVEDDLVFKVAGLSIEDITIPASAEDDPIAMLQFYKTFKGGPVTLVMGGAELFGIESIVANNDFDESAQKVVSGYDVTGIRADLEKLPDPEAAGMAAIFGLSTLTGEATGRSEWTLEDGHLSITEASMTFADIGKLDFTMDITGYTLAVVEQVQQMAEMSADADEESEAAAMGMMMGLMSKVSFGSASVRFDDDGITSKIIAFLAEQNGAPPEVMAAGFAAMLPAMAAEAGMPPEVQSQLMQAGTAFLTDPQSIEISVSTDAPVPFSAMAETEGDPSALLELVDITITGNQ